MLIYENLRDDGVLSANGEFAISQNNPFHSKFKKGDVLVLVRALVGQQWSQAGVIMVKLISTPPTPIPILSLSYFPDQDGNEQLDPEITGMNDSISSIRIKVDQLTSQGVAILQEASAYHGYKDSATEPSLNYFVFDSREFLSPMPVSNNEIPWKPGEGIYRPDYMGMLEDINICDYVDNKGVKQVWLWSYHYGNVEPAESNMAMGNSSQAYWNQASYGDISNSEQTNDMPTCSKTYTLYNYNYARELGEMMENHGHQIEAVLKFIDLDLFWNKFVGPYGGQPGERRCGWTHYAPNGSADYDWQNENDALSDCENWTPDGIGQQVTVDCHTWHGTTCTDDGGTNFKKWWMQNIPGKNNALTYQGKNLKNWWDFLGDFDQALQNGKGLTY